MYSRLSIGLVAALFLVLPATSNAAATRAEFIAQVDPICKRADAEILPLTKASARAIRHENLRLAARKLSTANKMFRVSLQEIAAVPPPPSDEVLINRWEGLEYRDTVHTEHLVAALKNENLKKARAISKKSAQLEKRIDRLIGDYGFNECN